MASKVWTMDKRSLSPNTGFVPQVETLFDVAGFEKLIKPGDNVAVKIHCGEYNNTAYLRPVYVRAIVDKIKGLGGRPFVVDTCTLTYAPYAGRSMALDLLHTAERNGFTSATLGAPFMPADGFSGTDDVRIPLPEGYILQEAYVAKAIALADAMIVMTHFKGHPIGVIGGAVKNLGIGAQSKRGKYNVHMGGHPDYSFPASVEYSPENLPEGLADMVPGLCVHQAFTKENGQVEWHGERCRNCLACVGTMTSSGSWDNIEVNHRAFGAACADACLAVQKALDGKIGYLNLGLDISPKCDCVDHADIPVVPHLGIFAGYDPVALDKACLDKVTELPGTPGSASEDWDVAESGDHKFSHASSLVPGMSEEIQLNTGVENGLGVMEYELVEVPEDTESFFGFPDERKFVGTRMAALYEKENPFPEHLHEGRGFDRKRNVDLDKVAGPKVSELSHLNGHGH
tara:strand:- start:4094 stop:5464 length:1371 start_codon:yes stop_codon:yes gene_type:complete